MENLVLISEQEQNIRISKIKEAMALQGIEAALLSSNVSLYYLTGRVYSGYALIMAYAAEPIYFVKRPVHLLAEKTISMRKPEGIPGELKVRGISLPETVGLELGRLTYDMAMRLAKAIGCAPADISGALSMARSQKTEFEIQKMKMSGLKQERVYRQVPRLFNPGMTDIELQIEIERTSRLEGCLGQFRVQGEDMELYMGNILAGDNADAPSPYDFAMGGAGMDPSLPVGANGTSLRPGMSVMVDVNGNFTGYMTDMTRTFTLGSIEEKARYAHQVSIDICHALQKMGAPGIEAKAMYEKAAQMAADAGLEDYFMGHHQHAGFVGHGVGIEINELPVLAPRSRDVLAVGNAIAIEPKFVIPGVGAVGIENTYIVADDGLECITNAPEELISLDK
ncbi:MAG: Xaa-Pro peptidase family protein [Clostridium sp.]|nr:Xaa-Pro peptidase family protein [Clostridium sp.]